jgi:zinc protease
MSESFPGFGYLAVNAVVAPEKADQVFAAIDQAAAELRDKPISADLMARARNPEIEQSNRALRDNAYWLASLSQAQSDPERLRRIRERRRILESITPAELQQLAKQYLGPGAIQRVRILSSRKTTTASR